MNEAEFVTLSTIKKRLAGGRFMIAWSRGKNLNLRPLGAGPNGSTHLMLPEPFLKCRRFRVEPDVFSEFHVRNHLGTVFPRPVVDPGLRNIQVIGQVIHTPELQSGLLLQYNLGRADRATSASLSGEVSQAVKNRR